MISEKDWKNIQQVFKAAQKASLHSSIATVDQFGQPSITPIGTVFLNTDQTGYFFDTFTEKLRTNLDQNSKACIQAINSSKWFWLSSLIQGSFTDFPGVRLQGSFTDFPGVRLYVEIGDLRLASREERFAIDRRIQPLQWTKGSQLIWSEFTHVRDIKINEFRWIKYPKMMEHLI
ncbi:pyridoxamine 5'-phosphate oxidase family protein [Acinetobacter tjernbergiae]|uniref:Pyridoxamine 5'-phosphate oxidase N-terminal domain-containing protein n=1 Tax=Acinetobacter tjernbergiae DSM 14971 = CIP 107465 TaxID=1120928 RepID=V2V576_9GAMM|nr:pyridoxamine 5'-phosphate oxidase family protein [Acinetobacter tjernbergiae]ESK56060.1 hypothetical protein F990_01492 [Acinetobacter tjernbergiae DSM 14971 = CIP 107465]